jgi:RNA polymerase sigma-70 factor (ECF subfamily)
LAEINEGIAALDAAIALRDPGPYQVQAAISALHAQAPTASETDWDQIALLYDTLAKITPSVVVEVNRAVAVAMAMGPQEGLQMLLRLENEADNFYPYHAARADLLRRMNQRGCVTPTSVPSNSAATPPSVYLQQRLDDDQSR